MNAAKAVFRGKFIALYVFIMKKGRPKISNVSFHLRKLEKEDCKEASWLGFWTSTNVTQVQTLVRELSFCKQSGTSEACRLREVILKLEQIINI